MPDELTDLFAVFRGGMEYTLKKANAWVVDNKIKVTSFYYVVDRLYLLIEV